MQVVVTSYQRPKYLKPTLESLRQDDVELFVVDGGSDEETVEYIKKTCDKALFFKGNPGADALKTAGVQQLVTDKEFVISSDDLVYPKGYSQLILSQYRQLNKDYFKWTFIACSMDHIIAQVGDGYSFINGVKLYPVATSQVAGAIIDTEVCKRVGYFPVYGKSGQGDWAFSRRLREQGLALGYFRYPVLKHIGSDKDIDYPEYSQMFRDDELKWRDIARRDELRS